MSFIQLMIKICCHNKHFEGRLLSKDEIDHAVCRLCTDFERDAKNHVEEIHQRSGYRKEKRKIHFRKIDAECCGTCKFATVYEDWVSCSQTKFGDKETTLP